MPLEKVGNTRAFLLVRAAPISSALNEDEAAIASFEKALAITPADTGAMSLLALVYAGKPAESGQLAEALRLAGRAAELNPKSYGSQLALGVALYRAGRYRESAGALGKSLDLGKGTMAEPACISSRCARPVSATSSGQGGASSMPRPNRAGQTICPGSPRDGTGRAPRRSASCGPPRPAEYRIPRTQYGEKFAPASGFRREGRMRVEAAPGAVPPRRVKEPAMSRTRWLSSPLARRLEVERLEDRNLLSSGYVLTNGDLYQNITSGQVLVDQGVKSYTGGGQVVYDLHTDGTVYLAGGAGTAAGVWKTQIGSGYSALVGGADGNFYALNPSNHDVYRLSGLNTWASTNTAHDVASLVADGSGAVYELSFVNHGLWQYTGGSSPSWTNVAPSDDTAAVAVDAAGNLYALSFLNHNVWSHVAGTTWASTGTAGDISAIATDAAGYLYALSSVNDNVWVYTGKTTWDSTGTAGDIAAMTVDAMSGDVCLLSSVNHNVWLYTGGTSGSFLSTGTAGDIASIAVDATGTIYGLSFISHDVLRYGTTNPPWSSTNTADDVASLVADGSGAIYELSFANHGVWQYNGGSSPPSWSNAAPTNDTAAIAVDAAGNLYALSFANHNVWLHTGGTSWASTGTAGNISALAADGSGNLLALVSTTGAPLVPQMSGSDAWVSPQGAAATTVDLATLAAVRPAAASAYSPASGVLFGPNGATFLDITQGIDDCWLMAGLAAVAARTPADIQGMFTYVGSMSEGGQSVGIYTVRYYDNGVANYVVVDTELPNAANGYWYVHPVGGSGAVNGSPNLVLWPALAEKAYAEANAAELVTTNSVGSDSYAALIDGSLAWSLSAVTGGQGIMNPNPQESVADQAAAAWKHEDFVGLGTATPQSSEIVGGHAYAMVDYDALHKLYQIFNPWGTDAAGWVPGCDGQTLGLFWAGVSFVNQNFISVGVGSPPNLAASPDAAAPPAPRPAVLDALFAATDPGPSAAPVPASAAALPAAPADVSPGLAPAPVSGTSPVVSWVALGGGSASGTGDVLAPADAGLDRAD